MAMEQDQELQDQDLGAQDSSNQPSGDIGEKSLDEILDQEAAEAKELDAASETEGEESAQDEKGKSASPNDGNDAAKGEAASDGDKSDDEVDDYKANTKYKVQDQEYEFHDSLKDLVTEENEPILRELHEKAKGLELVKPKLEAARSQLTEVTQQHQSTISEVGRVLGYLQNEDLDSFFESLKVDPMKIIRWAAEKAAIAQLPPEQRAVYTERDQTRRRLNQLETQNQAVTSQRSTEAGAARAALLDAQLTGNESVKSIASEFDKRNGPGSYRTAVMQNAHAVWVSSQGKRDLTPEEAVTEFNKTMGLTAPKPTQQAAPKPGMTATRRVVTRPKVKTIPNVGGSQASALADRKPKSIADLKKIAKEKFG